MVVLDYYQQKTSLKTHCRACEKVSVYRRCVVSIFVYMGIVGHDGDIVGHFRSWSMGKLYLNMWLVSFGILWTFTNIKPYKPI